jgi:hypothetical protein
MRDLFDGLMIIKRRRRSVARGYGTITQKMFHADCLQMEQP